MLRLLACSMILNTFQILKNSIFQDGKTQKLKMICHLHLSHFQLDQGTVLVSIWLKLKPR